MSKKVAMSGIFIALAMIFSYIEVLIPINLGIPGVKLGLANLVVVTALYTMGARSAFNISVIRVVMVAITFGNMSAMFYSLAGGLLSFAGMVLLKKIPRFSMIGVSVIGGILHNIGQIVVAALVVENLHVLFYLPVLLVAGTITGTLIGIISSRIVPRIEKVFKS